MSDLRKTYVISSGAGESGRLYLQQWLWKMQLGWDVHPRVQLPEDGEIQIADLGCGNGAWLLSAASAFDDAQTNRLSLSGFDISPAHYPAPENLPAYLKLSALDALTDDLPQELVGKFDLVHIRMFTAVIKNNNPGPLLSNAIKMLKPGGFLQWDEMDSDSLKAIPPSAFVSAEATQEMLDTSLQAAKKAMNLDYAWISILDALLDQHGLSLISKSHMQVKKELRKALTDSLLMSLDHIAKIAVRDGRMVGTDKNWAELWNNSGVEVEQGVSVVMDMFVFVGCKPAD